MELATVIFDTGPIATLTVNRPTALNALNREVLEDITRVIRDIRHDPSVRVLIVTGAGDRAFVAGADIAAMSKMTPAEGLEFSRLGHRTLRKPRRAADSGYRRGKWLRTRRRHRTCARLRSDHREREGALRTA